MYFSKTSRSSDSPNLNHSQLYFGRKPLRTIAMRLCIRSIAMLGLTAPRAVVASPVWRRALKSATWLRPLAVLTYTPLLLLCGSTPPAPAEQHAAEELMSSSPVPDAPLS